MNWNKMKVKDFAQVISGGTPSTNILNFWGGNISWITPKDLSGYKARFISHGERNITEEGLLNSSARLLPKNTVLLTTRAPIGYVAISENELATNQGFKNLICNEEIAHFEFVYYMLKNSKGLLESHATGSTFKELSSERLKEIYLPIPPLIIQKKIASILSGYDSLIENNRRRIQLLEHSARLLYREWFVHLRFPGHEHVRIIDGVPEEWKLKRMEDVAETVGGGTPSTKVSEYWDDGEITWFIPTDLTNNDCLVLLKSERKITEAGLKESSAKMVPPETILMTSRATLGFFGLYDGKACTNQGFISIIPRIENFRMYMLQNLTHRKEQIISLAVGTTYKEINKTTFRNMNIVIPSLELLKEYEEFTYNLIKQVRIIKKQNQKLIEARDILLPRLMNGEIAV